MLRALSAGLWTGFRYSLKHIQLDQLPRCPICLRTKNKHRPRNIVITRNSVSSNETLADDVTDPGEKGFHVFESAVVLWVVRRLLRRCRIDKESGGCIIIAQTMIQG